MKISDSFHKTETRAVMTAGFNEENCARCPAGKGQIENRDDNIVARECKLQQTIAEGRLSDASNIRRRIETAFGHTERLPECNALKNLDTLEGNVQTRIIVEDMLKELRPDDNEKCA